MKSIVSLKIDLQLQCIETIKKVQKKSENDEREIYFKKTSGGIYWDSLDDALQVFLLRSLHKDYKLS